MATLRNEMDVREEIATPFLKQLGYEIGSANDIQREHRLRYAAMQLGRKKPTDVKLPQGGSADYLLTVLGAGRWILETKPPEEEITVDDIDQAVSYARHPEVSGQYAAILNGRRLVIYRWTQTSNEAPFIDLAVTSPVELAGKLEALLTPAAIRRDCAPRVVDLRKPLAPGLRGEVAITGGWNKHLAISVETKLAVPPAAWAEMNSGISKIKGMQSTIQGGRIWRDEASRIRACLSWYTPHQEMKEFLDAARLDKFEYLCLSDSISADPTTPSVFDIVGSFNFKQGQATYDLLRWEKKVIGVAASVVIQGQATGFLDDGKFLGLADFRQILTMQPMPTYPISIHFETEFSLDVDQR